jgi:geranylgeranyl pyrophosphate synthase
MKRQSAQQSCQEILELYGSQVADKARKILIKEPSLKELKEPLKFIMENWKDLTPALMSLSCQAVEGKPAETTDPALAVSLMNLSFTIWDDIIDEAQSKAFKPTLFGKFGHDIALIVGGVASAKAFTVLNGLQLNDQKRKKINDVIWSMWTKMASAEAITNRIRTQNTLTSSKKMSKIKSEAIDLATSVIIGALIGNGSNDQINHLGTYGSYFGIILALRQDFQISSNLTLELPEKIKNNRLPYSILWATENSSSLRAELDTLKKKQVIDSTSVTEFVRQFLDSDIIDHMLEKTDRFRKMAVDELSQLPETKAKESLKLLVDLQYELFTENF